MKSQTSLRCQILVFCIAVASTTDREYESKLTKLWSLSNSKSDPQRTAIVDVNSASVLVQPTSYSDTPTRTTRTSKIAPDFKKYVFKSRSIPLSRNDQQLQVEDQNIFYSNGDPKDKYKTETLLPGNYIPIAEVKSRENTTEDVLSYENPVTKGSFQAKTIPLMRSQESQRRLLDQDEELITEKPEKFEDSIASRSISYFLDNEDEEDEEEEEGNDLEGEFEPEDIDGAVKGPHSHKKRKGSKKKQLKSKRMTKYMLPLLLAYKLKFFALIPLLIAGLILLIGATGLAGFFFALFAAVMGLQKGSY